MEGETDDKIAVSIVRETIEKYSFLSLCSFDKGFHSPDNQVELKNLLETVVLPKKGRPSKVEKEREYSKEFVEAKRQHSAVESVINALEVHGLNRCPDHGIEGFKRYVLARNIQKPGAVLRDKEKKNEKRKQAA